MRFLLLFCAAPFAWAQISGAVVDAVTGAPIEAATVSAGNEPVYTDARGHYKLTGLNPGTHAISAYGAGNFGSHAVKSVTLAEGQTIEDLDLRLPPAASLSGRIVDENREPAAAVTVFLVAREYARGSLRYLYAGITTTNDKGEYTIKGIPPGRAFLLGARRTTQDRIPPVSDAPRDPKLRKRVVPPTYYPNVDTIGGAEAITLRPGEHREAIDIRLLRAPSFCLEGTFETSNGPAKMPFFIEEQSPASGAWGDVGVFTAPLIGTTAEGGKIRLCGLHPGEYVLSTAPPSVGQTTVTIAKEDLTRVRIYAATPLAVPGEVVWLGEPPKEPVDGKLGISVEQLGRTRYGGEDFYQQSAIPGSFRFPSLFVGEYDVQVRGVPAGVYVKDITYGTASVLHEPLRIGNAVGNATLRIQLARDGGSLSATVVDADNHPQAGMAVAIIPAEVESEAALADRMIAGQTDQNGAYSTRTLPPGKYTVLAAAADLDKSPESIGKLWRSRVQGEEVKVATGDRTPVVIRKLLD